MSPQGIHIPRSFGRKAHALTRAPIYCLFLGIALSLVRRGTCFPTDNNIYQRTARQAQMTEHSPQLEPGQQQRAHYLLKPKDRLVCRSVRRHGGRYRPDPVFHSGIGLCPQCPGHGEVHHEMGCRRSNAYGRRSPLGKTLFRVFPDGKPTLVTVVTRGVSDDCNSVSVAPDSVSLRMAKSSKTYVFYFSTDGQSWQILRTFNLDTELPVRAGFESQSPAGSGAVAKFSAIAYDPHRIGDTYK
jgi:Protein of unknown function (DUF1349)